MEVLTRTAEIVSVAAMKIASLHTTNQRLTRARGFHARGAVKVTTVARATKVKVHLKVSTSDGNALVEKDVQGTARIFGEKLKATFALAKDIAGTLRDASLSAPAQGWRPVAGLGRELCRGGMRAEFEP